MNGRSIVVLLLTIGAPVLRTAPAPAQGGVQSISGRVLDERGRPAVGVEVGATRLPHVVPSPQVEQGLTEPFEVPVDELAEYWADSRAVTDVSGSFVMSKLQPGSYRVGVLAGHNTFRGPSRDGCAPPEPLFPDEFNFLFKDFRRSWPPGFITARDGVHHIGAARGLTPPAVKSDGKRYAYVSAFATVDVSANNGGAVELQLSLREAAEVRGVVVAPNGRPTNGVNIVLKNENGFAQTSTEIDGSFVLLDVPFGDYALRAFNTRYYGCDGIIADDSRWRFESSLEIDRPEISGITIPISPQTKGASLERPAIVGRGSDPPAISGGAGIRGRVTAEDGSPVDRARVVLSGGQLVDRLVAVTDDEGRFAWASLAGGTFRLAASREGFVGRGFGQQGLLPQDVEIVLDGRQRFSGADIVLPRIPQTPQPLTTWRGPAPEAERADPGARLEGRVSTSRGAPDFNATVIVFSADPAHWTGAVRRIWAVRPKSDGTFAVSNLPAGRYLVAAIPPLTEWPTPAWLQAIAKRAGNYTLSEGDKITIALHK